MGYQDKEKFEIKNLKIDEQREDLKLAYEVFCQNYQELEEKNNSEIEILLTLAWQNELALVDAMTQVITLEEENKKLKTDLLENKKINNIYQKQIKESLQEKNNYKEIIIKELQKESQDEEICRFLQEELNKIIKKKIRRKK